MESIDLFTISKYAALVVAVVMTLNAVFLIGFSRHRLRAFNVYIVFSIAALGARLYIEMETGMKLPHLMALLWANLAVGSVLGLVGMMRLADRDPQVWANQRSRNGARNLTLILFLLIVGLVSITSAGAQEADPCKGLISGDQVGVPYEGKHCILVEPEKGPVQGIFVRRVEDLDGVTLEGVIIANTANGWTLIDDEFVSNVEGSFATAAVGDGYHIVVDEENP